MRRHVVRFEESIRKAAGYLEALAGITGLYKSFNIVVELGPVVIASYSFRGAFPVVVNGGASGVSLFYERIAKRSGNI